MLTTLIGLAPILGAALSGIVGVGTAIYMWAKNRAAQEQSPEMKANVQAKTDLAIEQQAEAAVEASDRGDLSDERKGDAE